MVVQLREPSELITRYNLVKFPKEIFERVGVKEQASKSSSNVPKLRSNDQFRRINE